MQGECVEATSLRNRLVTPPTYPLLTGTNGPPPRVTIGQ